MYNNSFLSHLDTLFISVAKLIIFFPSQFRINSSQKFGVVKSRVVRPLTSGQSTDCTRGSGVFLEHAESMFFAFPSLTRFLKIRACRFARAYLRDHHTHAHTSRAVQVARPDSVNLSSELDIDLSRSCTFNRGAMALRAHFNRAFDQVHVLELSSSSGA